MRSSSDLITIVVMILLVLPNECRDDLPEKRADGEDGREDDEQSDEILELTRIETLKAHQATLKEN